MAEERPPIFINITAKTVLKIILVFLLFYFLYLVRETLIILFISLILASAIDPLVDWLQKRKIPRSVSVIMIYLLLFFVVGGAIASIIPPMIEQISELSNSIPTLLDKITSTYGALKDFGLRHGVFDNLKQYLDSFGSNLAPAAENVFATVSGFFGGIISFILILVITFYMTVEENAMKKIVVSLSPVKYESYIMDLIIRMQNKVGLWLRGQLIQSLVIFVLVYLGLTIMGVKYALTLAFIAGLIEFIPYFGPILSAFPAIFLAFVQSPILALMVAALYYIIQLVENNILVPKIMQKVVGLNPIVSIAVLLIGFKLAGVVGAIMAIPVATAASVFIVDIIENKTPSVSE